ncbi:unnamed protein product [Didymodactylos carnosus]|uniref:DUF4139 domain-containing protein n=1 Tax=Didymodactylos carnosus TaxID=1234261 RepID=A0A814LI28_9BILA|nr:unnamed protein product [Didymodactylos carnosus]CAF1065579.1 unnamed protein product [Didymodactylos carnosus]CAF3721013.1 unnamed protein product [Didymodactylos carnosus]CAF3833299.1 unnamed protein product [Didymodactylos carnosus]
MYCPLEVYQQIITGSLSVEGPPVVSQNAVTKANNLEGQTVFVQRPRELPIECVVTRSNDLLLKDVKTNRYFRASQHELEFVTIPEEEGTEVTFALKQSGAAMLCYLIQGITWSPRYNLKVEPDTVDQVSFLAWADMTNSTKRDYKIKHVELFGGDVPLQHRPQNYFQSPAPVYQKYCCCSPGCDSAPKIVEQGEIAGLYYYSLDQSFVLASQSTFSLPFVEVNVKMERIALKRHHFNERSHKGKFDRVYRIEGDKFLPKGTCTVRENGRVVGQVHLPDMGVGDKHDLECGSEFDVGFSCQVTVLSQKRYTSSYAVKLTIKNTKEKRAMKYEYHESSGGKIMLRDGENRNSSTEVNGNAIKITGELQPDGDEHVFEYEAHFDYTPQHADDEDKSDLCK